MPFDRLIRAVDGWAREQSDQPMLAQIGPGAWKPQNMRFVEFLSPGEFRAEVERAHQRELASVVPPQADLPEDWRRDHRARKAPTV